MYARQLISTFMHWDNHIMSNLELCYWQAIIIWTGCCLA